MRTLLLALATFSLVVVSTGCASSNEQAQPDPTPQTVTAPPPEPVYPAPCPKLRQCLDAFRAAMPDAANEFDEVWAGVKSEYSASPERASNRCAMSLRGYAGNASAPPSCK